MLETDKRNGWGKSVVTVSFGSVGNYLMEADTH